METNDDDSEKSPPCSPIGSVSAYDDNLPILPILPADIFDFVTDIPVEELDSLISGRSGHNRVNQEKTCDTSPTCSLRSESPIAPPLADDDYDDDDDSPTCSLRSESPIAPPLADDDYDDDDSDYVPTDEYDFVPDSDSDSDSNSNSNSNSDSNIRVEKLSLATTTRREEKNNINKDDDVDDNASTTLTKSTMMMTTTTTTTKTTKTTTTEMMRKPCERKLTADQIIRDGRHQGIYTKIHHKSFAGKKRNIKQMAECTIPFTPVITVANSRVTSRITWKIVTINSQMW